MAEMSKSQVSKKVSRREFLGVAKGAAVGGVVAAGLIGGVTGYYAGASAAPTVTTTSVVTSSVTVEKVRALKAGYFYPGPAKDYGWSYAHDNGRRSADKMVAGVSSSYIENVRDEGAPAAISTLLVQGAELIVACSFGFMNAMVEAAAKNPDKYFVHISGYKSGAAPGPDRATPNLSTAFAEFYQLYY